VRRDRYRFLLAALLLSSCGKPLGAYRVDKVSAIDSRHIATIEGSDWSHFSKPLVLRIDFSSTTDLIAVNGGGGLYIHGDFCPFRDRYKLAITGPYPDDKTIFYKLREEPAKGGEAAAKWETRHPTRDGQGRYHYTAYLRTDDPTYDLRRGQRDYCLRIDHPDIDLIPSQSAVFVLRGADAAKAMANAAPVPAK
jgi:hypothetical protein